MIDSAPNMIGDLLGSGRAVLFMANRGAGGFVNAVGSANLVYPAVADNNSPLPLDRLYFRYNYAADALRGIAGTRLYDPDQYIFGFEKTFLDRRGSLELRVPFGANLASDLDLSQDARVVATPTQNASGDSSSVFGNLTLVFKWLLLQRDGFWLSAGVAGTAPTGPDTRIFLTDSLAANATRTRDLRVANQTWTLSPYFAALATPTERAFVQGFVQYDAPLNNSAIIYAESVQPTSASAAALLGFRDHIRPQPLLHLDLGGGYWLVRDPDARWLTGFAPSVEVHYTSSLTDADRVNLPGPGASNALPAVPHVGDLRGHIDLVDLTLATTFQFGGRTRLATAFTLPLRGADNRTYDWDFQLQLNYYFGRSPSVSLRPPGS